jgi:hypothetical protein
MNENVASRTLGGERKHFRCTTYSSKPEKERVHPSNGGFSEGVGEYEH